MPSTNANTTLRLAVSQCHTLPTISETLSALSRTARLSSCSSIDLLLFPEAYLGGYPRGATFGTAVGTRDPAGKEQFLQHFKDAVDLGDTPRGEGESWVKRTIGGEDNINVRGDGTREELENIARETGVFLVVGLVERAGGTLYCGVVYVCPKIGIIGKRRKVMPTGSERLIWGQGQPASLRAVTTTIRGVKITLAAAICWENYMPLLRHSLYSQNVNIYLAPTADARDTWVPLMRTVACEGRCFVLSANQCIRKGNLPEWLREEKPAETARSRRTEKTEKLDTADAESKPATSWIRRKSVVINGGHEIALPGDSEKDKSEEAVVSGQVTPNGIKHQRTSSFITENGHEIVFPVNGGESQSEQPVNGIRDSPGQRGLKQESSFLTDDGHQIVLPSDTKADDAETGLNEPRKSTESRSHGRRKSFVTEHGHEIIIPSKRCQFGKPVKRDALMETAISNSRDTESEFACRGGSCIIGPGGDVLAGPAWEKEDELLMVDVDFDDCIRGRLDLDVAGSYSRNDAFKLTVEGLDINPPP